MYNPIDYNKWDFSGHGNNILPLLNEQETAIWHAALPYQDKRDDPGQGEMVTYFTLQLLGFIPEAERAIAVPAAILHDTGWGMMEDAGAVHRDALAKGIVDTVEYRKYHQDKSVELAREILSNIKYSPDFIAQICHIIGDHDTRLKKHTVSGTTFMDADVLWRFTVPHWMAYLADKSLEEVRAHLYKEQSKTRFYHAISNEIADKEIENTLAWCAAH